MLQALPQFPPAAGNSRPISFRKVLLNTCQEEFEGATAAREVRLLCCRGVVHGAISVMPGAIPWPPLRCLQSKAVLRPLYASVYRLPMFDTETVPAKQLHLPL